MTGTPPGGGPPSGYLEFFILEAGEYIEQLDRLLTQAASTGTPEAGAMQRIARALRGTATMARIPAFAAVASGFERVGRSLQQASLRWEPALSGALVAAVDDLKLLVRAARNWGPSDEQRAAARTAELARFAPVIQTTQPTSEGAATSASYLASEASNVAAGLELLAARSGDTDTAANVLRRVRALRGFAGVKEVAPLADALEATEDAARGLELGEELSAEGRRLLEASSAYLRTLAHAIRGEGGGDIDAPSAARDAFHAALENWSSRSTQTAQVVPIDLLFYEGSGGLVEPSQNPPTSSKERFRIELVSLGEHLRQVVGAAHTAHDTGTSGRARRDLKRAVLDAQATAQSFGATDIAAFIETHLDWTDRLDFLGLSALDDLASSLADPGAGGERLRARAQELAERREVASSIAAGLGAELPPAETPVATPTLTPRTVSPLAIATPVYTPAVAAPTPEPAVVNPPVESQSASGMPTNALDSQAADLIESSIAALDALNERPFFEPTPLPEDTLVPIDTLVYRGRAALDRAIELRDDIRRKEGGPSREVLNELFDLLELARAE
jgi:hypothetical protein